MGFRPPADGIWHFPQENASFADHPYVHNNPINHIDPLGLSELPNIQLYQENPILKPLAPAQNDAPPEKKKSYDQMRWEHDYKMALEDKALDEAYKEKLQVGYTGLDFFLESAPLTGAYLRDDKIGFLADAALWLMPAKVGKGFGSFATTEPVLFGQKRIDPTFSNKRGVPSYLADRPIGDVAGDLRAGVLSPDQLPIGAFRNESGQLVSRNNRTLAALYEAGMAPTKINIGTPTRAELRRLTETPIINSPLPGPRIPITPSMTDLNVLRTVEMPR